MGKEIINVDKNIEGIRLDKAISIKKTDLSRMAIQRMIEDGEILVNDKISKSSYKLNSKDIIEINEKAPVSTSLEPEDIPLDIVYEDEDIIVINKQKGLVVHPGNGNPNGTLVNAVLAKCKDSLSGIGGEIRPGIVHRIDKDTSGILIVAKNDKAHINMSNQIKEHKVVKTYLAITRGRIKENEATINMPIGRNPNDRVKMAVNKNGKEAITHIKVLEKFENYTFIEVKIETGRTHQIRVHLAEIGYPLVGDYVYSNGKNPFGVKGQMLHSFRLEFEHPITKEKMKLEAKLPEYFEEVLTKLRSQEK